MPHTPTPWVGLAALVAMFVLPMLPDWLFEGPRTIKHRSRRHICADCSAPWTSDHDCAGELREVAEPLRGELRRLDGTAALKRYTTSGDRSGRYQVACRASEAGVEQLLEDIPEPRSG